MKRLIAVCGLTVALVGYAGEGRDEARVQAWENGGRAETLSWFNRHWFGVRPVEKPTDEVIGPDYVECLGGKIHINIYVKLPEGASAANPAPGFILGDHYNAKTSNGHLDTMPGMPTNAIVARGYAYIRWNFNDVTPNTWDGCNETNSANMKLGGMGKPDSWGTISAWAWGFSRVMDWVESQPELDAKRMAVIGHSRGGKTALWAGCTDPRIALTISNCSGTGGARYLHLPLEGMETIDWMKDHSTRHWFCPSWIPTYRNRETEIEHDADEMMMLVAPRLLYVASGSEDHWAGPAGEFESAKRASALWRAYGEKGLSMTQFPEPGAWDHSGKVGYHLRPGPHKLSPWDWHKYMDFMDRHLPGPALHGRTVSLLTRVNAANAAGPEERTCRMTAWRGERVHAQTVAWCAQPCGAVRYAFTDLKAADGAAIPSKALKARPVKDVEGVPDLLDCPCSGTIGTNRFLATWVTVEVPRDAKPGLYRGTFTVRATQGRTVAYPIELEVLAAELPARNDFYLDIWQNACAVARYHHVRPYSPAHYAVLEPLLKELAAAGQKAITTPICLHPWGKDCLHDEFVPLVKDTRYPDGRCELDFTKFDEYVAFARSCGIGPQIHCYTILKFAHRFTYYYTDGETGEEKSVMMDPDTQMWRTFWKPYLQQFEAHVRAKGWLDDTYIAVDEADPQDQFSTRAYLKEVAPSLKYACAANKDGRRFKGLEAEVYSQILWRDYCSPDFLATIPERRAKGQITTFYVCTQPAKPNTWFRSPLAETAWMGLFASAKGFDGFLRWAAFHWTDDPLKQAEIDMPAGEVHFLYPGARASTRWEILRDSIENYLKIAALRAAGKVTPALEGTLKAIDFEAAKTDDAETCQAKVEAVIEAMNAAVR